MTSALLWLGSFALLPLAGAPLLAHPRFRPLGPSLRIACAGAVGAVLLSAWMTLAALIGFSWGALALLLLAALVAGALRPALRGSPSDPAGRSDASSARPPARWLWPALAGLAVAAALDVTAVGGATSVDLVLQWGAKARQFAQVRTIDTAFLADPENVDLNPSYPPLVPNVGAFATLVGGRLPWKAAPLVFPLLLAVLAAGLLGALSRAPDPSLGSAGAALAVAVLAFAGVHHEVAGNADPPLWLFEGLAIAVLSLPLVDVRAACVLGGLLFAGAATAKLEGVVFAAAAAGAFLWQANRGGRRTGAADAAFLLLPTAVALGCWFAFGFARGLPAGYGMGPLLEIHFERTGRVLAALAREIGRAPGPFAAALLFLAAAFLARRRPASMPLFVAGTLALFLLFTYLHGAPDPGQWILWSAGRVLAPIAFLVVLAAAGARPRP
jgi:hypothetical protein